MIILDVLGGVVRVRFWCDKVLFFYVWVVGIRVVFMLVVIVEYVIVWFCSFFCVVWEEEGWCKSLRWCLG